MRLGLGVFKKGKAPRSHLPTKGQVRQGGVCVPRIYAGGVCIRTRTTLSFLCEQTHPTDRLGGFPRRGTTVGISHASCRCEMGPYIRLPSSQDGQRGLVRHISHTSPRPFHDPSIRSGNSILFPFLTSRLRELPIHPRRRDRNLLLPRRFAVRPAPDSEYAEKHKERLNFMR